MQWGQGLLHVVILKIAAENQAYCIRPVDNSEIFSGSSGNAIHRRYSNMRNREDRKKRRKSDFTVE